MTTQDSIQRFTRTVDNYVKYRPTYPQAIVDFLRRKCSLDDQSVVADIGCGTGLLAQRFLENGFRVTGVEPNDNMRGASQKFLKDYATFTSTNGTAEATTLATQCADLITVGQAFHWFEPEATRQEFVRLLKAKGWVALIWNLPREDSPFMAAYQEVEQTYRQKSNSIHFSKENADEKIQAFFAPQSVTFEHFDNVQPLGFERLKGLVLSSSHSPKPDQPEYEMLLNGLETLFQTYQQDGQVAMTYTCLVCYGQLS